MKIWNSKRYYHVFKTYVRQKTTPKRYQKLEFQTPKRYNGHPYHFTLKEPHPPGKTLTLSFISHASTFLVHVSDQ